MLFERYIMTFLLFRNERAAFGGHKDLVEIFIERGANDWMKALKATMHTNNIELAKFIITKMNKNIEDKIMNISIQNLGFHDLNNYLNGKRFGQFLKEYNE